ncbi:MAG TPA: UbiA family prenyltransferase, partial [Caulobacteraceae bacterium]|nr:UbiA family prenyltransferase [Caulobacteraceae bacterium]
MSTPDLTEPGRAEIAALAVEAEPTASSARHGRRILAAWASAARPHQWSKNAVIFAPVALGWKQVTPSGVLAMAITAVLFCALSSLSYIVNDVADMAADRRHPSKRHRPFASGVLPAWQGLLAAGAGIPLVLVLAWLVSPAVAVALTAYCALTFAYSAGLKRAAIVDCVVIGALFTLRVVAGVA